MTQLSMFGPGDGPAPKPESDETVALRVMITVKAAPNPSERHGETVCVAGISADLAKPGWVRLYPINFRDLGREDRFRKYDIVALEARPARQDQRRESYKPLIDTMVTKHHLRPWEPRRRWVEPYIEDSMCRLNRNARASANAQSLAAIRPRTVDGLDVEPHPGWTRAEQTKIDAYVGQLDLFGTQDRTPLQAPRFKAAYRYRCHEPGCGGHRQGVIDWELVAFQRKLGRLSDSELCNAIRDKFLGELCGPAREVAFYVGNQAKRTHVFSVLGVYWPPRR
jgi:hypothetical protein